MFFYARSDTHFLLYIYDNMRNELIEMSNPSVPEENRIETALQKSKETSLLRFERQIYNAETGKGPGGWYSLVMKTPSLFNSEQFAVFRAVHAWRDQIARHDDDSTVFIMPNHVIFTIAKILPADQMALLAIANPISHSVKSRAKELLDVIKSAKVSGKTGPTLMDVLRPNPNSAATKANAPPASANSALYAPETLVAVVDEGELRSEESAFWGSAFGSSIWDPSPNTKSDDSLRLAVPLPQLSSEIFASGSSVSSSKEYIAIPSRPVKPTSPTPKVDDEAFVLKRGAKRKSDIVSEVEEDNDDQEYDISLDIDEKEKAQEKAMRKEARAAAKRERKERKAQMKLPKAQVRGRKLGGITKSEEAADDDDGEEEEPFDYTKADSVLHAKRTQGEQGGGKRKKPFDPYAKSVDAPKGMRRLQTERPGKSHTFKN
jgi:exosome complex exonuclease RRP6